MSIKSSADRRINRDQTERGNRKRYNRHKVVWRLLRRILPVVVKRRFDYVYERIDSEKLDGPVIVIPNHACAWDPILVGLAFHDIPLSFVASEHVLRIPTWGRVIDYLVDIIPHSKGLAGIGAPRSYLKKINEGRSIFLAAEGEQSWDGLTGKCKPGIGKFIKKSGANLVTYKLEGNYLAFPRWAEKARRVPIQGKVANIYNRSILEAMEPEEIENAINSDLAFNAWEELKEHPLMIPDIAEGLETFLFTCPECGEIGKLRTDGDAIECECGFRARFTERGSLNPGEPFSNISVWSNWEAENLSKVFEKASKKMSEQGGEERMDIFRDPEVTLRMIGKDHSEKLIASGDLALFIERTGDSAGAFIGIGDEKFLLSDISKMAMILRNRIVFSTSDSYLEIKGSRINLYKYVIMWELVKSNNS